MLHQPLTNRLSLDTWIFLENVLPLAHVWTYIYRIIEDGDIWDDLPVDRAWHLVCSCTQLCNCLTQE
jgi:hypothetical protein